MELISIKRHQEEKNLACAHLNYLCITLMNLSYEFIDDKQDIIDECISGIEKGIKKHPTALDDSKKSTLLINSPNMFVETTNECFLRMKSDLLNDDQKTRLSTVLRINL